MKSLLLLSSLLIVVLTFSSCAKTKNQEPKKIVTQENKFTKMRSMCLNIKADQLNLTISDSSTIVFGMVMDWEMGNAIATLCAFKTGDASLYLSSGGGVIGGGQHENVSNAAITFITKSQGFLSQANKSESNSLPEKNNVNFYFLTNKGTYLIKESMSNIDKKDSKVLNLFLEANKVLTELRLTTEK